MKCKKCDRPGLKRGMSMTVHLTRYCPKRKAKAAVAVGTAPPNNGKWLAFACEIEDEIAGLENKATRLRDALAAVRELDNE